MIDVDLPVPPSLNNAYVNVGKKRVPSRDHVAWKRHAGWELKAVKPRPQPIIGAYKFTLLVAKNMRGDVSNRIKLPEDLFVQMALIPDDRHAVSATCRRDEAIPYGRCRVLIEDAE